MATGMQVVTAAVPARYYVALIKALFLKGATLATLWVEVGALLAVLLVLAALLARRADRLGLRR
jgi:ABC-type multidrug transport system permease subunit